MEINKVEKIGMGVPLISHNFGRNKKLSFF